jgi:hypothetical protein
MTIGLKDTREDCEFVGKEDRGTKGPKGHEYLGPGPRCTEAERTRKARDQKGKGSGQAS